MDSFEKLVWKYDNPGKLKQHVWVNLIVVIYLGHCQIKDKWPWKNDPENVEIGTYGAVLISNFFKGKMHTMAQFLVPLVFAAVANRVPVTSAMPPTASGEASLGSLTAP